MLKTRNLIYTALCTALGIVLPFAFHGVPNAGSIFLPMHIPVLLCGLICGWEYGVFCGALTPFLSSVLTGMPPAPILPGMVVELAVYGLVAGLAIKIIKTRSEYAGIFASLIVAMLAGRIVYGLMNAFIFRAGSFSISAWLTASFVTALPGIAAQIVIIPALVFALRKAKIVETTQKITG